MEFMVYDKTDRNEKWNVLMLFYESTENVLQGK